MSEDTNNEYPSSANETESVVVDVTKIMRWVFAYIIVIAIGVWGIIIATYLVMNQNDALKTINASIDRLQDNMKSREKSIQKPQTIIKEKMVDTETPKKLAALDARIMRIEKMIAELSDKFKILSNKPEITVDTTAIEQEIKACRVVIKQVRDEMNLKIDKVDKAKNRDIIKRFDQLYKYIRTFSEEVKEKVSLVTKTEGALLPPPKEILKRKE